MLMSHTDKENADASGNDGKGADKKVRQTRVRRSRRLEEPREVQPADLEIGKYFRVNRHNQVEFIGDYYDGSMSDGGIPDMEALDGASGETSATVTGYPLEYGPPEKLRKEFHKKKKGAVEENGVGELVRLKLQEDLQTLESEKLTQDSELRHHNSSKLPIIRLKLPPTQTLKKIKRRKTGGGLFGYNSGELTPRVKLPIDNNEDFCYACGEPGSFLCCEGCPRSFHFTCLDPPLDEDNLPEGDWYCNQCRFRHKRADTASPVRNGKSNSLTTGIFGKLFDNLELMNPHKFELPRHVRERYQGVSTGKYGEYQDEDTKTTNEVKRGVLQQLDPVKLYNKDGEPYLCYKCGESGLHGKELAQCEYCDLVWHLDCINPPLPSVKMLGTKWKCPSHVDDLYPEKQRRVKKSTVVDVSVTRGFKSTDIDVANDLPNYIACSQDSADGVKATIPKELLKNYSSLVVYRLPESSIIYEFADKIKQDRQVDIEENNLLQLQVLEKLSKDKINDIKSLLKLKNAHKMTFQQFVDSVVGPKQINGAEDIKEEDDENHQINGVKSIEESAKGIFKDDELQDLLYIRRLIKLKGKNELLKFLHS